jgi:hypothetical protein
VPIQKGQVVMELSGEMLDEEMLIKRADKRFVALLDEAAPPRKGISSRAAAPPLQQSVRGAPHPMGTHAASSTPACHSN